jgi:hypothetical protein
VDKLKNPGNRSGLSLAWIRVAFLAFLNLFQPFSAFLSAVELSLYDLFYDLSKVAELLLEAALVFGQELVEVIKQHPIEDSLLGLAREVDSRHIGKKEARIGPGSGGCRKVKEGKELRKISFRLSPDGVNNC